MQLMQEVIALFRKMNGNLIFFIIPLCVVLFLELFAEVDTSYMKHTRFFYKNILLQFQPGVSYFSI